MDATPAGTRDAAPAVGPDRSVRPPRRVRGHQHPPLPGGPPRPPHYQCGGSGRLSRTPGLACNTPTQTCSTRRGRACALSSRPSEQVGRRERGATPQRPPVWALAPADAATPALPQRPSQGAVASWRRLASSTTCAPEPLRRSAVSGAPAAPPVGFAAARCRAAAPVLRRPRAWPRMAGGVDTDHAAAPPRRRGVRRSAGRQRQQRLLVGRPPALSLAPRSRASGCTAATVAIRGEPRRRGGEASGRDPPAPEKKREKKKE